MTRSIPRTWPSEFGQRVSEILYYQWDPLGISNTPACRDEYDVYAEFIVKLYENGDGVAAYATMSPYLWTVAINHMGLEWPTGLRVPETVEAIHAWWFYLSKPTETL